MIVIFLVAGIFAGVIGMITAALLGLGLGLALAAYPVFGMVGVGLAATLAFGCKGKDVPTAESSLG